MKKLLLAISIVLSSTPIWAQTVNVHFKNGTKVEFPSDNVDYVDFSVKLDDPIITVGSAVDLGLSVYWASCNLGAESSEESGNYYAWGETSPKTSYTEETYAYYDNDKKQYIDIGSDIAGTQYDGAHVNLGGSWSMPTRKQMQELIDSCTWEWTQVNGINGYTIIGKNGNSIFLPAAGHNYLRWGQINDNVYGFYWTSTKGTNNIWNIIFDGNNYSFTTTPRYHGQTIRPVTTNKDDSGETIDHSQDYLVTDKISLTYNGGSYSKINDEYQSGSQFQFTFSNNSSSSVTLTGIYLLENGSTNRGNNTLASYTHVNAGESKGYTITLNTSLTNPQAVFTYLYNKKIYSITADVTK